MTINLVYVLIKLCGLQVRALVLACGSYGGFELRRRSASIIRMPVPYSSLATNKWTPSRLLKAEATS